MNLKELVVRLPRPSVILITGRRGSGKDVTACAIARETQRQTGKKVLSNYDPDKFALPKGWKKLGGRFPRESIILLSDSHLELFSRDWRTDFASAFIKMVSISRHRDIDFIYTSQLSTLLDRQVVSNVDALVFKEPSALADRFERPEIRSITEEASNQFEGLSDLQKWRRAYVYTHTGAFVVDGISKPAWWTEDMSKLYGRGPVERRVWPPW